MKRQHESMGKVNQFQDFEIGNGRGFSVGQLDHFISNGSCVVNVVIHSGVRAALWATRGDYAGGPPTNDA